MARRLREMVGGNGVLRPTAILAAALALIGCGATPKPPAERRPEWHGAAVDGLAPLMTPRAVEAALARHGYTQVPCTSESKRYDAPLYRGGDMPCYRSAARPMAVSLFFLDLKEGRRLAVVNFRRDFDPNASAAKRLADSNDFARRVAVRFGPPFITSDGSAFRTYYWRRPGGQASLPDMLSTTVGADFPPNLTMTSMWAYGQVSPAH